MRFLEEKDFTTQNSGEIRKNLAKFNFPMVI
jgi:hypothetical protein